MKPKPVPEHSAEGEIARVYHEIRQSLQVTGVNLNFRTWASFPKFLPAMWEQMRPNAESEEFKRAADRLRAEAVRAIDFAPRSNVNAATYGASRAYHIRAALELYHYINPKLLVFTSAVLMALEGERIGTKQPPAARSGERGEPDKMLAMEMESDRPEDEFIEAIFSDIKKTLGLAHINSDYRTLALWPDYLSNAWQRLKPLCLSEPLRRASDELRQRSRQLARDLPHGYALDVQRVRALGENPEQVLKTTQRFERLLPTLILNIAILHRDWESPTESSPAPRSGPRTAARKTAEPAWRTFQKRQKVHELGDRFVSYIEEGDGDPVVLLHGIPSWSFLWDGTISALAKDHRVIAPDLLGFGYSDKRDCFDRSIATQAQCLRELLDVLGIESAHIVAHDIGGGVALRLATLNSERVRSLCVMNTVCYDSWPIEMMLQFGHPLMRKKISAKTARQTLGVALKMGFHSKPDREWLDGLLSPWRTEEGKLSLIRNASALNTNLTTEITRLLPKISAPTLILWGEDDKFQRVEMGERLARDIPGAQFEPIADARHFVMIDQPATVHGHLRRFLDRNAATNTTVPTPRVALRAGYAVSRNTSRRRRLDAR